MKRLSRRALCVAALATAFLPVSYAQYIPTTVAIGAIAPIPSGSSSQQITLIATVTATSTVNSGTVWFSVLGSRVPAAVSNGTASATFIVPGAMPAGSYPVTAAYVPDDSIHITNVPKTNNIWAQVNQQFPNTGVGTPGSPTGVPNATYLYNPAAYTSPNYVGYANVVSNSATFLIASDANGHDYGTIQYTGLTIATSVNEATAVHLLTASYGGTNYHVTFSGTGGALESFSSNAVGDLCNSGGVVNTAAMQNGSASNNVFDQTAFQVRDVGGCQTGNSATGPNYSYFLYEQTFLLNSSFANQALTSIVLNNNNGGSPILLFGITAESAAGPFFTSSSDGTGQLVIGQASSTVTWANPTAGNVGPIAFSPASQTVNVSATVTAAATVNSGTVAFSLLGNSVTAPVSNGAASASIAVPGGTSPGSYPIMATYTPGNGGSSTSYYLTNFPKNNNIYTNLNQQFPNTGPGIPGSGVGTSNAGYLYNPATYTSPAFVAGSDLSTNGGSFLIASDNSGRDFLQVTNNPPTLVTNISAATAIHVLTASYSDTTFDITITGDGGAVEAFQNIEAPNFCVGGHQINSNSMQNGSTTNNVFDQSVLYMQDYGACYTGNSSQQYAGYFLYEQTFLLDSRFTSQNLSSISLGDDTNNPLLLLGVTVDGMLSSSTDSRHNLVIGQSTPVITWPNPADIVTGTALGPGQLDAAASVAGSFVYNPAAGTVLAAGSQQQLSVTFIPSDNVDYTTDTATVNINVGAAPLSTVTSTSSVAPIVYSPNSQSITLTASVTSSSVVSGGTVSFGLLGTTVSASVTNGSASTSFIVAAGATAGTYTIHATYNAVAGFAGSSDNTHQLTIGRATPAVTWANPADISAGTALGSTQLDATANVPGTFVYSPPSGTVPAPGNQQALGVAFSPTDVTDYTTVTATAYINVNAVPTTISFAAHAGYNLICPSCIGPYQYSSTAQSISVQIAVTSSIMVSGGTLSFTVLGATASAPVVAGYATITATIPAGTRVGNYPIQATYNPSAGFAGSSSNGEQLAVTAATPVITWATPANINFGAALGPTQLNAAANAAGTFVYNPPAGTMLSAGTHALGVTFTPTDTTDYTAATDTVSITVTAGATVTTIVLPQSSVTYSLSEQGFIGSANVTMGSTPVTQGSVTFSVAGHVEGTIPLGGAGSTFYFQPMCFLLPGTPPGTYTLLATYNPAAGYAGSSATATLTVGKATPTITWANPANIPFGTPLGAAQLDAKASVPGKFTYSPPLGTVLQPGAGQTLKATFTPNDGVDYTSPTDSVAIGVNAPAVHMVVTPQSLYQSNCPVINGSPIACTPSAYNVVAMVQLTNAGTAPLQNVQLTAANLGTDILVVPPLPQTLGAIAPGATVTAWVNLIDPGTPSTTAVLTLGGTYSGGSFNSTSKWTLPAFNGNAGARQ